MGMIEDIKVVFQDVIAPELRSLGIDLAIALRERLAALEAKVAALSR